MENFNQSLPKDQSALVFAFRNTEQIKFCLNQCLDFLTRKNFAPFLSVFLQLCPRAKVAVIT
jgi:hypothetical protein